MSMLLSRASLSLLPLSRDERRRRRRRRRRTGHDTHTHLSRRCMCVCVRQTVASRAQRTQKPVHVRVYDLTSNNSKKSRVQGNGSISLRRSSCTTTTLLDGGTSVPHLGETENDRSTRVIRDTRYVIDTTTPDTDERFNSFHSHLIHSFEGWVGVK